MFLDTCASLQCRLQVWSFERSAESRDTEGGTSKRSVLEQCAKLKKYLADTEAAAAAAKK